MKKIIEATTIEGTPQELARAFCNLGSNEQAEFFAECERVSLTWTEQARQKVPPRLCLGAWWQWQQVGSECLRRGLDAPAARVLATMAAPLFAHTLAYTEARKVQHGCRIEQVNG